MGTLIGIGNTPYYSLGGAPAAFNFSPSPGAMDGTGDYTVRNSDLTANADGKVGTFICKLKRTDDGALDAVYSNGAAKVAVLFASGNTLDVRLKSPASDGSNDFVTAETITADGNPHIIAMSWDVENDLLQVYNGDTALTPTISGGASFTDQAINYTPASHAIGALPTGANTQSACMYVCGLYYEYVDFSVEANRRRIYNASLDLSNPGSDGSDWSPTATKPIFLFTDFENNPLTNTGTGGDFDAANGSPYAACT